MITWELSVFSGALVLTLEAVESVEVGLGGVERPFIKQPDGSDCLPKAPGKEGDILI